MLAASLPSFQQLHRLRAGAVVAPADAAAFRIRGGGAASCLQGLWTNDIVEPGDGTVTYGALLTPKGMIVSDGWVIREADGFTLLLPAAARGATVQILQKSLPPRLATFEDLTDAVRAILLLGDAARDRWPVLPLGRLPEPGSASRNAAGSHDYLIAAPSQAPFAAVIVAPPPAIDAVEEVLRAAGMAPGGEPEREAMRILAGWPALGAEIDDRTLPQEVRFDEHVGISYTKGCYTGQETVARLHFRGHANRALLGLRWLGLAAPEDANVMAGEKVVGRIGSVLNLPDRTLGLAVLRRELRPGDRVTVGGATAMVTHLPFGAVEVEG